MSGNASFTSTSDSLGKPTAASTVSTTFATTGGSPSSNPYLGIVTLYADPPNEPNWNTTGDQTMGLQVKADDSCTGKTTLTATATLTWTPDYDGDPTPPPATVDVVEGVNMVSEGEFSGATYFPFVFATGTASDSFGDVYAAGQYGISTTHRLSLPVPLVPGSSLNRHKSTVILPQRTFTVVCTPTGQIYNGFPVLPDISCNAEYSVSIPLKAVRISASVDPTRYKAPFLNTDGTPMTNYYRDALYGSRINHFDGINTMRGDIGLDTTEDGTFNSTGVAYTANNYGVYYPVLVTTDPTASYTWFHNLLNDPDATDHIGPKGFTALDPSIDVFSVGYNGVRDNPPPPGPNDPPSPSGPQSTIGTDHVYFTFTPVAGTLKYTSNYYMNIHPGSVWTKSLKTPDIAWREAKIKVDAPGSVGNNGTIGATWQDDNPLTAPADLSNKDITVATLTVLGASTPNPLLNGLLTAAGIGADKLGPIDDKGTADFDGCWNSQYSTFSSPIEADYYQLTPQAQSAVRDHYSMVPFMFMEYTRTYYQVDRYVMSSSSTPGVLPGYQGQYFQALDTLLRTSSGAPAANPWCGAFTYDRDAGKKAPPHPHH